jgi:hypothetical protein
MPSPFRWAGIITAILVGCGPALAQQIAPPGSGVSIEKQIIDNGLSRSVKYFVTGGSPQLQALVRRVEWAENELGIIDQLQLLKLDTVVNERRIAAVRTAQLANPFVPTGFLPPYYGSGYGYDGASHLQRALSGQLAYEATPQAALQLIGFLEQQQAQLDAELKALPPQEKKAAQGTVDALRPRLAALHRDVPAPKPQLLALTRPLPVGPPAPGPAKANSPIEVQWGGSWFPAEVLRVNGGLTLIHYTGWGSSSDEWVSAARIRLTATASALPQIQMPLNPLTLPQMVQQQFTLVQQALTQSH